MSNHRSVFQGVSERHVTPSPCKESSKDHNAIWKRLKYTQYELYDFEIMYLFPCKKYSLETFFDFK